MRTFKILRSRKGVSITEAVIAMAIVMIVASSAIGIIISSAKADAKFAEKTQALSLCESTVECIRFAEQCFYSATDIDNSGHITIDENTYCGNLKLAVALGKLNFKGNTCIVGSNEISVVFLNYDEQNSDKNNTKYTVTYNGKIIYETKELF